MIGAAKIASAYDVAPVLGQPPVQRVDHGAHRIGIVGQAFFERAGERRPQQRAIDAHLLHELEPRFGIEERVDAGHRDHLLVEAEPPAGAEPRAALRHVEPGTAGYRDLGEGRVGDVVGDLVAQRELRPTVDLDVLHDPFVFRRQELRERVARLVEMVVGVEGRVRQVTMHELDVRVAHVRAPASAGDHGQLFPAAYRRRSGLHRVGAVDFP